MANPIISAIPIYVDGVKVADATGGSYSFSNGVDRVPTNDYEAYTMGRVVTTVSINTLVLRAGMRVRLIEAVTEKKDVRLQMPLDGKVHEVEGKFTEGRINWEHGNGSCTGEFTFMGSKPQILG